MESLSGAHNTLAVHFTRLEARVCELEKELARRRRRWWHLK